MKVKVESCWSGNGKYYYRCTFPDGERIQVGENTDSNGWCKEYASELRDYAEHRYGAPRNSVKVELL